MENIHGYQVFDEWKSSPRGEYTYVKKDEKNILSKESKHYMSH